MIQAVVRSMGVAAVKGNHKAQTTLTEMVRAVQAKRHEETLELFKKIVEYKDGWEETFKEYDRRGELRPDPIPHPDDMKVDFRTGAVKFNGPFTADDKAQWDNLLNRRKEALEEIALLRQEMKGKRKLQQFYQDDIDHEQRLADMISGIIPDEKTRRQPGFDIDVWRARNGVLESLEKRQRARRKVVSPLVV